MNAFSQSINRSIDSQPIPNQSINQSIERLNFRTINQLIEQPRSHQPINRPVKRVRLTIQRWDEIIEPRVQQRPDARQQSLHDRAKNLGHFQLRVVNPAAQHHHRLPFILQNRLLRPAGLGILLQHENPLLQILQIQLQQLLHQFVQHFDVRQHDFVMLNGQAHFEVIRFYADGLQQQKSANPINLTTGIVQFFNNNNKLTIIKQMFQLNFWFFFDNFLTKRSVSLHSWINWFKLAKSGSASGLCSKRRMMPSRRVWIGRRSIYAKTRSRQGKLESLCRSPQSLTISASAPEKKGWKIPF